MIGYEVSRCAIQLNLDFIMMNTSFCLPDLFSASSQTCSPYLLSIVSLYYTSTVVVSSLCPVSVSYGHTHSAMDIGEIFVNNC